MNTSPVFIDANIFMYAAGRPHSYREACITILEDIEGGLLTASIDTEIMQEILYRYWSINSLEIGLTICRAIVRYAMMILPVTTADMVRALDLVTSLPAQSIKPRDAVHAACMQNNGLVTILSADRDFEAFSFVERIDPLDYVPRH